jgi:hypothetical protein
VQAPRRLSEGGYEGRPLHRARGHKGRVKALRRLREVDSEGRPLHAALQGRARCPGPRRKAGADYGSSDNVYWVSDDALLSDRDRGALKSRPSASTPTAAPRLL